MIISRQETSLNKGQRVNQRARTRAALVAAAVALVREGRQASIPDAAERALVSVATAYRYFPSAEGLWEEASLEALDFMAASADIERAIEAAGSDPAARLEALVQTLGWRMLEDQVPFRRMAKAGLDRWFAQQNLPPEERVPVRQGRRNRFNQMVVAPLRGKLTNDELDRLVAALGVVLGTEAAIALLDVSGLDVDDAKATMLRACRWVLAGAIADARQRKRKKTQSRC